MSRITALGVIILFECRSGSGVELADYVQILTFI